MNRTTILALAFTLLTSSAAGLPAVGEARPPVWLVDAWGRSLDLGTLAGMPVLVVYEDKDSARQNEVLKAELAALAKGDAYRRAIALVAVADVDGYDYWPVRGFVKDAIKRESVRFKTPIYCDWDGAARGALGVRQGTSSEILYGWSGAVLLAHEGPMPAAKRAELIELLRGEAHVVP